MENDVIEYEISRVSEARGLSEKQEAFVRQMVLGDNPTNAARVAGYADPNSAGYDLVRLPKLQREIRSRSEALLMVQGSVVGVSTLISIAQNDKAPSAARVQAANSLLDRAGIGKKESKSQSALANKPIGEMDMDELHAFISAGSEALNRQRSNKAAVDVDIIDVTTQVSAQDQPGSVDT